MKRLALIPLAALFVVSAPAEPADSPSEPTGRSATRESPTRETPTRERRRRVPLRPHVTPDPVTPDASGSEAYELSLSDITLAKVVPFLTEWLSDRGMEPLTIVLDEEARDLRITELTLRAASAKDAVILIAKAAGADTELIGGGESGQDLIGIRIHDPSPRRGRSPVARKETAEQPKFQEKFASVYPLWMLGPSSGEPLEDTLGELLESVFETAGLEISPQDVAFHSEARIMVLKGTQEHHDLAKQLLQALVTTEKNRERDE